MCVRVCLLKGGFGQPLGASRRCQTGVRGASRDRGECVDAHSRARCLRDEQWCAVCEGIAARVRVSLILHCVSSHGGARPLKSLMANEFKRILSENKRELNFILQF